MKQVIEVGDIVEGNGRTWRQNRLAQQHQIPIGTLVDVEDESIHSYGAFEKVQARLFVVAHNRDCDGSPLYSLANLPVDKWFAGLEMFFDDSRPDPQYAMAKPLSPEGMWIRAFYGYRHGFGESSLQVAPRQEKPDV